MARESGGGKRDREGEEKKGHSVLGNIVKFKRAKTQRDMRSRKVWES